MQKSIRTNVQRIENYLKSSNPITAIWHLFLLAVGVVAFLANVLDISQAFGSTFTWRSEYSLAILLIIILYMLLEIYYKSLHIRELESNRAAFTSFLSNARNSMKLQQYHIKELTITHDIGSNGDVWIVEKHLIVPTNDMSLHFFDIWTTGNERQKLEIDRQFIFTNLNTKRKQESIIIERVNSTNQYVTLLDPPALAEKAYTFALEYFLSKGWSQLMEAGQDVGEFRRMQPTDIVKLQLFLPKGLSFKDFDITPKPGNYQGFSLSEGESGKPKLETTFSTIQAGVVYRYSVQCKRIDSVN